MISPQRLLTVLTLAFALLQWVPAVDAQKSAKSFWFFVEEGSFSMVGQWAPADPNEKNSMPREVQIDCFRDRRICIEASAEYYIHAHVAVTYPTVLRWDNNGLVLQDDSAICMSRTIVINFAEKSSTATRSPKALSAKTKEACQFFGMKGTEQDVFVIKGSKRWEDSHSLLKGE